MLCFATVFVLLIIFIADRSKHETLTEVDIEFHFMVVIFDVMMISVSCGN